MTNRILVFFCALLLAFLATSCGGVTNPVTVVDDETIKVCGVSMPSKLPGLIAFTRDIPDDDNIYGLNREIFIMGQDGYFEHRITWDPGGDDYPAWSPLGLSIAFVSNRSSGGYGPHDIFRMGPLGGVFQLTGDTWQWDAHATDWGPGFITAARINMLVGAPFDVGQVIKLDPFGNWEDYIYTGHIVSYRPAYGRAPNLLVFSARPAGATYFGDMELYLLTDWLETSYRLTYFGDDNPDPMHLTFTGDAQFDRSANLIIFSTTYWGDNAELGYLDLREADAIPPPHRLTFDPGVDIEPCWSPDGEYFCWVSNRDGNFELYKQHIWDSNTPTPAPPITRLTDTLEDEHNPDWGRIVPWHLEGEEVEF